MATNDDNNNNDNDNGAAGPPEGDTETTTTMTTTAVLPIKKLVALATLGFCALILGSAVLTIQLRVTTEKHKRGLLSSSSSKHDSHSNNSKGNNNKKKSNRASRQSTSQGGGGGGHDDDDDNSDHENEDDDDDTNRSMAELLASVDASSSTIKPSFPTQPWDIQLWANDYPPREPTSVRSSADAYWSQALSYLLGWDGYLYPDLGGYYTTTHDWSVPHWTEYGSSSGTTSRSNNNNNNSKNHGAPYPRLALEKAAKAGHPMAQYYLGNAMASGIWPVPGGGGGRQHEQLETQLEVFDEIIPQHDDHRQQHYDQHYTDDNDKQEKVSTTNHPQVTRSYLLWHMAAMAGNVDAAMTLAYRMDHYQTTGSEYLDNNDSDGSKSRCEDSLPYYEAAANGIIDQLETSMHSRAKVMPAMDRHILAEVHMHGGTSSQLDWHNKPDESIDALQYYHLKATTAPWSMKQQLYGSENDDDDNNDDENNKKTQGKKKKKQRPRTKTRKSEMMDIEGVDISAAFTLGHLYHHGYRGVEQNLTKALEYYEIAGSAGHWESSGHACTFYLWGMGMDVQDVDEALVYCRLGAPIGVDGCRARHEKIISSSSTKDGADDHMVECDDNALNGLGLLYLMGVKGTLDVDLVAAEKYFALAKELGNADAHYNLAMMWLGWKTHFKHVSELTDDGVSGVDGMAVGDGPQLPLPKNKKDTGSGGSSSKNDRYVLHVSRLGNDEVFKGPVHDDVTNAIKLLAIASKKNHIQAKHRLAMIYADGLRLKSSTHKFESVKKDCLTARSLYHWIIENASPSRSRRLRTAYKEYVAGNLERSLRNYLTVAETGSSVGQVNAAFLLERGTCLGLSPSDCAKASVRMWKAAAARGSSEACLRVGDFYYYGRMRGDGRPQMPFAWMHYVLYPEKYMPDLLSSLATKAKDVLQGYLGIEKAVVPEQTPGDSVSQTCEWKDGVDGTCPNTDIESDDGTKLKEELEADLSMAAHYYTVAVERHQSGRANFNLGFMHEWGLGLTQDFPLAKRHYDLAAKANPIAVQIALVMLSRHETFLRWKSLVEKWWNGEEDGLPSDEDIQPPRTVENVGVGEPVPMTKKHSAKRSRAKTRNEVIMTHLFNSSSVVIVILVAIVIQIYTIMRSRQRRR